LATDQLWVVSFIGFDCIFYDAKGVKKDEVQFFGLFALLDHKKSEEETKP
jgi:hypothetical protein